MGLRWNAAAADGPKEPTTAELRGHVQLTIPNEWNGNRYVHVYIHEKIFANFATYSHWRKFYHSTSLPSVNDCMEDMVTFTTLAKFIPPNVSNISNTKIARLGEIFVS